MDREIIIEKLKLYKKNSRYRKNIKDIGLFGSYAKGINTSKSDIDIFVKLETPKMFDLIGIKNDLGKLLGKKVDIIILGKPVNKYLLNQIRQSGIYV
jgi:predicted nucleotidyltransferase